jgi:hypothetical protein
LSSQSGDFLCPRGILGILKLLDLFFQGKDVFFQPVKVLFFAHGIPWKRRD